MSKLPRIPSRLFKWYCREDRYEELHGDLEEFYLERLEEKGPLQARLMYWLDVLRCFQSYALKRPTQKSNSNITMIRSNVKIAYRSLLRNKGYAATNILGLAIGISFSCMLFIYLNSELSYDAFHSKSEQIHRVVAEDYRIPDQTRYFGQCMPKLGPVLVDEYPEVVATTRLFRPQGQIVFKIGDQNHQDREWFYADQNFFEVFDFEFLNGNSTDPLGAPNTAVLTEKAAIRYFGTTDVIGKALEGGEDPIEITAVLKDLPENSHLQFNILVSALNSGDRWNQYINSWNQFGAFTYVVLNDPLNADGLLAKMPQLAEKYLPHFQGAFGISLQPLEDIYLHSENIEQGSTDASGDFSYIYIFLTMGIFILAIASINYINLATSKAMYRAKEIGIRKVIGAVRKQLIAQFMTESFLVSFIAMLLAIVMLDRTLPFFNEITNTAFDLTLANFLFFLPWLIGLTLLISLLSGGYPAFYLSKLLPVTTLRGAVENGRSSAFLRKGLVTFQFVLTIVMMVATIVIGRQMNFIEDKDMGFDKEQLMVIDINSGHVRQHFQTMKNELEAIPGVSSVGVSSRVPGEWKNIGQVFIQDKTSGDSTNVYFMGFDEGMVETFDFRMAEGDFFTSNTQNDSTKILLNQTAVAHLGLVDPIGKSVQTRLSTGMLNATIIGVIEDFNYQSLHNKIEPLIIGAWNNPIRPIDYFTLKVNGDIRQVIEGANVVHEKFDKFSPMEYNFLDEKMASFYQQEQKASLVFQMGAGLSIFVACMGLFGLASFTVNKRKKELGIRKVLGAGNTNLFVLLSSSFIKQIGIALVIAAPIAYLIMDSWLSAFVYRVGIGIDVFLIAGLASVLIALLTISYRSVMAVRSNPVDQLHYE
ncbi:MAG: ABC transporter permease [Cyclobacteriaceae bacterium]